MRIQEFRIERFYAKYEFNTPYMISGSDAETLSIEELLDINGNKEQNISNMLSLKLQYTEAKGDPLLREKISKLYRNIGADGILTYSGAEEGIFGFMSGVLQVGDQLIVQFPCYQSLHEIARANGVEVIYWEMKEEELWRPNFEDLNSLITEKTKAVLVNTPHNPTGIHMTKEEQAKLIDTCKRNSLYLFSDEVYRFGEYNEESRLEPAADLYEKAISLGVLSKPFGLPGLRLGWIATQNKELMQRLEIFKDYTTICGSAPSEFLAKLAIDNMDKILSRNQGIVKKNLEYLRSFMDRYSDIFTWVEPDAGNIAFIRPLHIDDVEKFCLDLIHNHGIVLLPSTMYCYTNSYFRIGFGKENFKEGLDKFEEFVRTSLT